MATSLTRSILEAHLAIGEGRTRAATPGAEAALRIDQVVMDADAAALVFLGFAGTGRARHRVELALACAEAAPPATPFEAADALLKAQTMARRLGVHFSRAGNGCAHQVHATRFAIPGRTVLACAAGVAASGALGALVLPASEIELAAAMAGAPHPITVPPVWAVRLAGTLPPWVGGDDLAHAVALRLPADGARGAALEFTGSGVDAVSLEARLVVARAGGECGAWASLFPSDAVTRRWLQAQGREPDWKALAGEPESDAARVLDLDLSVLEPMIAAEGERPIAVRELAEVRVGRIVLGPAAGIADLLALADVLRERSIAPGLELLVIPGCRQIRDTAAACGALASLVASGARIADAEVRLAPASPAGATVLCGASPRAAGHARAVFHAGAATAAASALSGRIADPRQMPFAPPVSEDRRIEVNDAWVLKPAGSSAVEAPPDGGSRMPSLPPITATVRGVVLLRLGDRVGTDTVLPAGPTVRRHDGDLEALAEHLFAGADRGFAARARAHGGGFVVAGADYGVGPRRPHAALAMMQLGVRAVLARSFAPGHRAELVHHGVLALRFAGRPDTEAPSEGDELEIPGLPDVLEPNRPLAVRDLTSGAQLSFHHDLGQREIEMVRAGGLVGALALAAPGA